MSWALLADEDTDLVQLTRKVMSMEDGGVGSNFCTEEG
jgi:hypothetical protein